MAVSNSVKPAMNFEPSGEIDSTFETKFTVRARSTVAEDTSYTKILRVLAAVLLTPMIWLPSLVASSALRVDRAVLPSGGATGGAAGVTARGIAVISAPCDSSNERPTVHSRRKSLPRPTPVETFAPDRGYTYVLACLCPGYCLPFVSYRFQAWPRRSGR